MELQPFATLANDTDEHDLVLVLSGSCEAEVVIEVEGHAEEQTVSLLDVADSKERAVAMASARLIELYLSAHGPTTRVDSTVIEPPSLEVAPALTPPPSLEDATALAPPPSGGSEPGAPQQDAPQHGDEPLIIETNETQPQSTAPRTPPGSPIPSSRSLGATPTLLWLPTGGANFGLDADMSLPWRGPLFLVLGTGFIHAQHAFDEGNVRLLRLDALAGAGAHWRRARFAIEGRLLARLGWARLDGQPHEGPSESQDVFSVGLQLDAGFVLHFGRLAVALRAGPLITLNGLAAENASPDAPRSYVSLNGVSVSASISLRVAL